MRSLKTTATTVIIQRIVIINKPTKAPQKCGAFLLLVGRDELESSVVYCLLPVVFEVSAKKEGRIEIQPVFKIQYLEKSILVEFQRLCQTRLCNRIRKTLIAFSIIWVKTNFCWEIIYTISLPFKLPF